jgi:hypothetical protein
LICVNPWLKTCFLPNEPKVVQCLPKILKNKVLTNRIRIDQNRIKTGTKHPQTRSKHPNSTPKMTRFTPPWTGTTPASGETGDQSGTNCIRCATSSVYCFWPIQVELGLDGVSPHPGDGRRNFVYCARYANANHWRHAHSQCSPIVIWV